MSLPARAVSVRTGHPVLKLVLLTVSVLPGYPTVEEVAAAAEMTPSLTEDALSDLVAARHITEHRSPGYPRRYALPDDGWGYTRETDVPAPAGAPVPEGVYGYSPAGRVTA